MQPEEQDRSTTKENNESRLADRRKPTFDRMFTLLLAVFFLVQAGLGVAVSVWVVGKEMSAMQKKNLGSELDIHRHAFRNYIQVRMTQLEQYAALDWVKEAVSGRAEAETDARLRSLSLLGDTVCFCLQGPKGRVICAPGPLHSRLPRGDELLRTKEDGPTLGVLLGEGEMPEAYWQISVPVMADSEDTGVLTAFIHIASCRFLYVPEDGSVSVSLLWHGHTLTTAGLPPFSGMALQAETGFPGITMEQMVDRKVMDKSIRNVELLLVGALFCGMLLLILAVRVAGRKLLVIPHTRLQAMSDELAQDMACRTADLERQTAQLSQEIQERRQAEIEAREIGQLVTALLEGINAAFYILHPATQRIIRANSVIKTMFGLIPEELLDTDCRKAFAATTDDTRLLLCPEGVNTGYAEGVGSRVDGTTFPMGRYLVDMEIRGEDHIGVVVLDISERKTLERRLHIAQKLESVGELASGIAHEINTPIQFIGDSVRFVNNAFTELTVIITMTRALTRLCKEQGLFPDMVKRIDELEDEADMEFLLREVPKACARALDGSERVAVIVRAMKNFAHPGDGKMKGVDINESLSNTITVAKNEWKYVANMVKDYGDIPIVNCLAGDINQVFLNIIVNAAHAIGDVVGNTGKKGTITVSTRLENGKVVIRIADTGKGIPPENREKIFNPFFTTKEVGRGTGQGLAIVHDIIVERHGGSIDVESEVGVGTTFVIALPSES